MRWPALTRWFVDRTHLVDAAIGDGNGFTRPFRD
jgi:hypothetical protein